MTIAAAARPGGLTVFRQTLLLLLVSLVASQTVAVALVLLLPPPRPEIHRLSELADGLRGRPPTDEDDSPLGARILAGAPPRPAGLIADEGYTAMLAARLDRSPADVRLFYQAEQRGPFEQLFERRRRRRSEVRMRRGEPIFFNGVFAAERLADGRWRAVATDDPPLLSPWQRRLLLWFGASALILLPFAWGFARAISRPIRAFAAAADRLGADPNAPPVPERGPAELRTTAHALNRMQKRVADHLAERTAMIGAIAHDLRTPLARIAFRIEAAPDPLRAKVQDDLEQMRAMIAATIGFVRHAASPVPRRPVDLFDLLSRIAAQEREQGRAVTVAGEGPLVAEGDPLALSRLFQNLVDNGIAYGTRVAVTMAVEGGTIAIRLADDGPGLPADQIERMFQPFQRGDPSRNRQTGGIGLGLTIARTIAEDHGGTIALANRPGGGLEATVRLPAQPSA
ncbi:MAG: ATP-binding protein [Sphingomonas fennica]